MRSVLKTIDSFSDFLNLSPGGSFNLLLDAYSKAKTNIHLVNAKAPTMSRHDKYSITLDAYGAPANPDTVQVLNFILLL